MDMEMNDDLGATLDRLAAASSLLEQTVERLEAQLAAAEQKLVALEAATEAGAPFVRGLSRTGGVEEPATRGRKTLPTAMANLLAKQGVNIDSLGTASIEAGSIDAALSSLSIEQRIAVKSQLLRAGLLS
jgi:hypothetical protein